MYQSTTNTVNTLRRSLALAVAATSLLAGVARAQQQVVIVPDGNGGYSTYDQTQPYGAPEYAPGGYVPEAAPYGPEAGGEPPVDESVLRLESRQMRQMMGLLHREATRQLERERRAARLNYVPAPVAPLCPAEAERRASNKLHLAIGLLQNHRCEAAARFLRDIVRDYPGTFAAEEACNLLASM